MSTFNSFATNVQGIDVISDDIIEFHLSINRNSSIYSNAECDSHRAKIGMEGPSASGDQILPNTGSGDFAASDDIDGPRI